MNDQSGNSPNELSEQASSYDSGVPADQLEKGEPLSKTSFAAGVLNMAIKVATMGAKFVLMLMIAKQLAPEALGLYGLVVTTAGFGVSLIGLEIIHYMIRELLRVEPGERPRMVRDQLIFHLISYIILLPGMLTVFLIKILPWHIIGWFYVILILEHLVQEMQRLLMTLGHPLRANMVLFLRAGAWVPLYLGLSLVIATEHALTLLWLSWLVGLGAAMMTAAWWLRFLSWKHEKAPIDWAWMQRGLMTCMPFFVASLASQGIRLADRYALKWTHGTAAVGPYAIFGAIGDSLYTLVDAGVIALLFPTIVAAFSKEQFKEYREALMMMTRRIIILTAALTLGAALAIYPLLMLIDKPLFWDNINSYFILLAASAVLALGTVPHFAIYVRHLDSVIVTANLCGLGVAVIGNIVLTPTYGLTGAACSTFLAFLTIGIVKSVGWYIKA